MNEESDLNSSKYEAEQMELLKTLKAGDCIKCRINTNLAGTVVRPGLFTYIIPFNNKLSRPPNRHEVQGYGLDPKICIRVIHWKYIILLTEEEAECEMIIALKEEIKP